MKHILNAKRSTIQIQESISASASQTSVKVSDLSFTICDTIGGVCQLFMNSQVSLPNN